MTVKQLDISSDTSVSSCIKRIFERANHVRFQKSSLFYNIGSKIDALSGATKDSEAVAQDFNFRYSSRSHHGLITLRDKRTGILEGTAEVQIPGERPSYSAFDWRTIVAFRLPNELNIQNLEAYIPGMGWISVDLSNRRFFDPVPIDQDSRNEFNEFMQRLVNVRNHRELVKKARDNGKKRTFMKGIDSITGKFNDRIFTYESKSGKTDKLFDGDQEVKKVCTTVRNKNIGLVGLIPNDTESINIPRAESPEDVANLAAKYEVLGEVEKHLGNLVRGTELSLIEQEVGFNKVDDLSHLNGHTIVFNGVMYKIAVSDDSYYDYPEGTDDLWRNGKLIMKNVETKAQWRACEVSKEVVTSPEMVEVE